MSLMCLPPEIVAKIAAILAKERFWYVGPLLAVGTVGRDAVYNDLTLSGACIYPLCTDGSDISEGGRHRHFFVRCIKANNPIALYHEGIRVATQEGDIEMALMHLDKVVQLQGDATLAAAIFSMCNGETEKAGAYLDILSTKHQVGLQSEEVYEMARELLIDIRGFNPKRTKRYVKTLKFPTSDSYPIPTCIRNGHHTPMQGCWMTNCCNECSVWWLANKVTWIL